MSRPRLIRRRHIILALTLLGVLPLAAEPSRPVRVLTIGNSFSRNATHYLGDLAKAAGRTLEHQPIVVGGASMELHATKARAFAKDPADPAGLYSDGKSLIHWLQAAPWDFVTIQQASIKSHDVTTYQPFAGELRELVARHAPTARLLIHQTWAYRIDDPRFGGESKADEGAPRTAAEMHAQLSAAYRTIARDLQAPIIPVGDAFALLAADPAWGFRPDPGFDGKGAKHPQTPGQKNSLHVGWRWIKQGDGSMALRMDGHHANSAGEYLGACVWFEALFATSVVGNPFVPEGVPSDFARALQQAAHQAVADAATFNQSVRSGKPGQPVRASAP